MPFDSILFEERFLLPEAVFPEEINELLSKQYLC